MAYFIQQKKPVGSSTRDNSERRTYSFAMRLPNAKSLPTNDRAHAAGVDGTPS